MLEKVREQDACSTNADVTNIYGLFECVWQSH